MLPPAALLLLALAAVAAAVRDDTYYRELQVPTDATQLEVSHRPPSLSFPPRSRCQRRLADAGSHSP